MRTIDKYTPLLWLMVLLFSCTTMQSSSNAKFLASSIVPAAEGKVRFEKDKNNNYKINIHIWNLAFPDKLDPAKSYYVVWMQTKKDSDINIGQIKPRESVSKVLKADIETVNPEKPMKIFISAEDKIDLQQPEGQIVLTTEELK